MSCDLQANLRACNEELRSHVDDLKQEMEVQRMAISRAELEKVLTFNTASRSYTLFTLGIGIPKLLAILVLKC